MLLRMKIYDELQKDFFFFYDLQQTIPIRRHEATSYFRLMTSSVDQSDSNELVTQRPVASLTDAARSDWLSCSLHYSCLLIWLLETFLTMGKAFRSETEISSAKGLGRP